VGWLWPGDVVARSFDPIASSAALERAESDGVNDLDDLDALDEMDELTGMGVGVGASVLRSFKGFISNESRTYLQDRDGSQNNEISLFEAQLELDLRLLDNTSVFIRPWFLVDAFDSDLLRYEPLEAFVDDISTH